MPWNASEKIADCREIARKWGDGIEQVIIIGINGEGRTVTATYGRTPQLCACARAFGDAAMAGIAAAIDAVAGDGEVEAPTRDDRRRGLPPEPDRVGGANDARR